MIIEETRVCSKCMEEKPIEDFRYLGTQHRFHSQCRQCEREKARQYQADRKFTPEQIEQRKAYRKHRYAVRSVAYFLGKYGDEIINEAKKQIEDNG